MFSRMRSAKHIGILLAVVLLVLLSGELLLSSRAENLTATDDVMAIIVTEVAPRNSCIVTDTQGKFTDYVEFFNPTDSAIDLGGMGLGDGTDAPRYVLPAGTIVQAGQAGVVFLEGFRLSAEEQLVLFDAVGEPFFTLDIPQAGDNEVLYLRQDGAYHLTDSPSPGYTNDAAGEQAFADSKVSSVPLVINEVCIDTVLDQNGEWVELSNPTDTRQMYTGIHLADRKNDLLGCCLPDFALDAGQVQLVYLSQAGFSLKAGETLYLSDSAANVIDTLTVQKTDVEITQNDEGILAFATPNQPNTEAGYETCLAEQNYSLVITEVMSDNGQYLRGPYGTTCDYVELYNAGEEELDLSSFSISDGVDKPRIELPAMTLQSGECVVFLAQKDGNRFLEGYPTLDMSISASGETIVLWQDNAAVDLLHVPRLDKDQAYGRDAAMRHCVLDAPSIGVFQWEK